MIKSHSAQIDSSVGRGMGDITRIGEYGRARARTRARRSMRLMIACGLIAILGVSLLVFHLIQRSEIVRAHAGMERARSRLDSLVKEHDRKMLDLGRMQSLDRVEQIARTRLGMVAPNRIDVVVVDPKALPVQRPDPYVIGRETGLPDILAGIRSLAQSTATAVASNMVAAWLAQPPVAVPPVLE